MAHLSELKYIKLYFAKIQKKATLTTFILKISKIPTPHLKNKIPQQKIYPTDIFLTNNIELSTIFIFRYLSIY